MKRGCFLAGIALLPAAIAAQMPTVREVPKGTSLGRFEPLSAVVELASGQVLVSESEGGAIWTIAPGSTRAERLKLTNPRENTAGLAWAGGDSAFTFSTRGMVAYPLSAVGRVGDPIGQAPEGAAMFMIGGSGAGSAISVDASGRIYEVERDMTGSNIPNKLKSRGKDGTRLEATLMGDPINRITIGAGGMAPSKLFSPGDGWAVRPDGAVAVVRADPYRVEWYWKGERTVEGPVVPYTPIATTTQDSIQWIESRRKAMERAPMIAGMGGAEGPKAILPAVKPAFAPAGGGVRMASDGSLWVLLHGPAGSQQAVWDHFDGQGQLLERVRFPEGFVIRGFGTGVAYATAKDGELFRVPLS